MEFGIFSNGFRPHTSAGRTYDEDIAEIVEAERLGCSVAYISEHHGEPPYIGAVDTIPSPEMMMCKAAALTTRIRMGAAIKLIHLHHPLDVAIQAAITHHMLGSGNRYIFGFGSGFPSPLFSVERGLSYEDRHERLRESLEFILKAWTESKPFDWEGKHWRGTGIVALPKPDVMPHLATATESEDMIAMAGEKGWTLLTAFLEPASHVAAKGAKYEAAARRAGRPPRAGVAVSRILYVADSQRQAIEEMRASVAYEVSVQAQRGFLKMLKNVYKVDVPNNENAIEALVESGLYILGDPDYVAARIEAFYRETGGFGTFLMVTGKSWSTRENRMRSMRRFMTEVVPKLRHLDGTAPQAAAAS